MRLLLCVVFLVMASAGMAQPAIDSLLAQLNQEIEKRPQYVEAKLKRIESLKRIATASQPAEKFEAYSSVYTEYKSFIYDSAFAYARRLQMIARDLKSPSIIADAKVKTSFILVSSGMFNEALDTMQSVKTSDLPDSTRSEYYYLMARACYDLADFNRDDFYRKIYTNRARAYIDSALTILPKQSVHYLLMDGLQHLHVRNMSVAKEEYEQLVNNPNLTGQQFAIVASTLSFIYFYTDQPELAKEMLIRAAIADIRSCTKETVAMLNLADLLHREGDIELAYKYVKIAMEDADYYGARQRRNQVAAVFPVIEGKQLQLVESKRRTLVLYSSLITIFTIMVVGFLIIIFKQNKKLQKAREIISQANESLTETNHQLQDANKIKEEYIWYYFNTTAEYINKLDALKKSLDLKLMTKKLEDLRFMADSINIKREREELYHNFDKVFLKLFPDFVNVFNSLFKEDDRIVLKEGQLLNTELRIFALIRMGIHDHERIAKILDYSVTTIYTYKTRIRNKSTLPNDEFDRQIMTIRAI